MISRPPRSTRVEDELIGECRQGSRNREDLYAPHRPDSDTILSVGAPVVPDPDWGPSH
jgi:hypothetical protein